MSHNFERVWETGFHKNLFSYAHYFFHIHAVKYKLHTRFFGSWTIRDKFPHWLYKNGSWIPVLSLTLLCFHCVLSKAESGGGLSWQFTFWRALSKWQLVYSVSPVQLRPVSHINEIQNGYCQEHSFIFNVVWASNHSTSHSYQISNVCSLRMETVFPHSQQWPGLSWVSIIRAACCNSLNTSSVRAMLCNGMKYILFSVKWFHRCYPSLLFRADVNNHVVYPFSWHIFIQSSLWYIFCASGHPSRENHR